MQSRFEYVSRSKYCVGSAPAIDKVFQIFDWGLCHLLQDFEAKASKYPALDDDFDMFGDDTSLRNGKNLHL